MDHHLTTLLASEDFARRIREFQKTTDTYNAVRTDMAVIPNDDFDYNMFAGSIMTAVNVYRHFEDQRVKVAYLAADQIMQIPAGLAIHPANPALSEADHSAVLVDMYMKAARMTYKQIYDIVDEKSSPAQKRAAFEALVVPNDELTAPRWTTEGYYMREGKDDSVSMKDHVVFGAFSRVLRLNFDIRDMGFLVIDPKNNRLADNAELKALKVDKSRFTPRLHSYTMDSIATLNYAAVGNWDIGAWVRSVGIGVGLLPNRDTKMNQEWRYTHAAPRPQVCKIVRGIHEKLGSKVRLLCLNIIAMFGLFHLSKNHTYCTGDAKIQRICTSYIMTLRTIVPDSIIDELTAHMEATCRTAAHPFGLGQTYWAAKEIGRHGGLASPLALRLDVTPPPVQRLFTVNAATLRWPLLPVGSLLNQLYKGQIKAITAEIAKIQKCPQAYSELCELYGVDKIVSVSPEAKAAADSMMPIVCGYFYAMHQDDELDLAYSFGNVKRNHRIVTSMYTSLWENYIEDLDSKRLETFVKRSFGLHD